MVQKGKGGKKKANDVNLFAPSNNNPVILPRKCLSRLMPHYAIFFFMVPKSLFIYLFIDFFHWVENEAQKMPLQFFYSILLRFIL